LKAKLSALFLGAMVVLLAMEIALRVMGCMQVRTATGDTGVRKNACYTILCLGDSFTFGSGASSDKSYPRQLQGLLNAEFPQKSFAVINRGVNAYTTRMILELFENYLLKEPAPDLVVLLAGGANIWNFNGYHAYLQGKTVWSRSQGFLSQIRLYRLAKLLCMNIRDKAALLREKEVIQSSSFGRHDVREYKEKIALCLYDGRFAEAQELTRKIIALNPGSSDSYFTLGLVYLKKGDKEAAEPCFETAIRLDPSRPDYYGSLVECFSGTRKDVEPAVKFLSQFKAKSPDVAWQIERLRKGQEYDRAIASWIASDLEKIVRICQGRRIRIILLDYPKSNINGAIREVAVKYSLPLVDCEEIFRKLMRSGHVAADFFVPDAHCNAKGYGIIAKNIYDKIVEAGWQNY